MLILAGTFPYAGYATPPSNKGSLSGVVILAEKMGNSATCTGCQLNANSYGVTLVHETAHYFGIQHTFNGGCDSAGGCKLSGDFICDTPPEKDPSYSCTPKNTCNPNDANDAVTNYMNYSPEICKTNFTADQVKLIQFGLLKYRPKLIEPVFHKLQNSVDCYQSMHFALNKNAFCEIADLQVDMLHFDPASYDWNVRIYKNGNIYLDTLLPSADKFNYQIADTGTYLVTSRVILAQDTYTTTITQNFVIAKCGDVLPNPKSHWYFGEWAGLEFRENGAVLDDKNLNARGGGNGISGYETSTSMSDSLGNFIWGAGGFAKSAVPNHFINGNVVDSNLISTDRSDIEDLYYSKSAIQSIAFLAPGSKTKHVLISEIWRFDSSYLYYRFIDTINGGYDVVGAMNVPVRGGVSEQDTNDDGAIRKYEGMCLVPSCDNYHWLIVARPVEGVNQLNINLFKVFDDTVIYSHNTIINDTLFFNEIKASPNNSFVTIGKYLFRFDNRLGKLTYFDYLFDDNTPGGHLGVALTNPDVCFSPNSKFAYIITENQIPIEHTLHQLDLSLKNPFINRKLVYQGYSLYSSMTLGPNNRIYGNSSEYSLFEIENPDKTVEQGVGFKTDALELKINGNLIYINDAPDYTDGNLPENINPKILYTIDSCNKVIVYTNKRCYFSTSWLTSESQSASDVDSMVIYSSADTLIVILTQDNKKDTAVIVRPTHKVKIQGPNNYCDTSNFMTYYPSKSGDHYASLWNCVGCQDSSENSIEQSFYVKPNVGSVTIYLETQDLKYLCIARDTLTANQLSNITNNIITASNFHCVNDSILATGYQPQGGNGTYQYSWEYGTDTFNWLYSTKTTVSLYNGFAGLQDTYYLRRIVSSGNCLNTSNIETTMTAVAKNKISLGNVPCTYNIPFQIVNDSFESVTNNFTYGYQYTTDTTGATGWQTLNELDSNNTAKLYSFDTTIYQFTPYLVRRYIKTGDCYHYSNSIQVAPTVYVTKQPHDMYICNALDGGSQVFSTYIELANPNNYAVTYNWVIISDNMPGGGTIYAPFTDSIYSGDFNATTAGNYERVLQCQAVVEDCGTVYSNYVTLKVNTFADSFKFTETPKDLLLSANDSGWIGAKINTIQTNPWTWEKALTYASGYSPSILKDNYVSTKSSYATSNDSVKVFARDYTFYNSDHYRVKISNGCYTKASKWTMVSNRNFDLYMKDFPADTGAEPNEGAYYNFTHSYDIWMSDSQYKTQPQNWADMDGLTVDTTNYIYIKVRNRSAIESEGGNLYLYWTNASTSEQWPTNWTRNVNNRRWNSDSGRYYYEGGQINNSAILIPNIPAYGDTTIEFVWPRTSSYADTIPQNIWYQFYYPDSTRHYDTAKWICVLARLETCGGSGSSCAPSNPDKGMSFKERDGNIAYNVIYNNNIVSSNMKRVYLNPPSPNAIVHKPVNQTRCRNLRDSIMYGKWVFTSYQPSYYQIGDVYVHLDNDFWQLWSGNNFVGSGFTQVQPGVVKVTNPDSMIIGPMDVPFEWEGTAGFSYHYKQNSATTGGDTINGFDFRQYAFTDSSIELEGTVSMGLVAPQVIYGEGEGMMLEEEEDQDDTSQNKEQLAQLANHKTQLQTTSTITKSTGKTSASDEVKLETNKVVVYPNPFTSLLKVAINNTQKTTVSIWLTDANGKIIAVAVLSKSIASGNTVFEINTDGLAAGSYIVHVNGVLTNTAKEKVVLIR